LINAASIDFHSLAVCCCSQLLSMRLIDSINHCIDRESANLTHRLNTIVKWQIIAISCGIRFAPVFPADW